MSLLSNLVVGIDGRPQGWEALVLAQRLAQLAGGHLTLACAFPAAGFAHAGLMWNGIHEEADARRVIDEARTRVAGTGDADFVVASGSMPGQVLHDVAASGHADLLVLGGSEHGAVGRVLGGSVLRAVLIDPCCPVAVAPRGHADSSRPIARIGVAVDGSPEALAALHWAQRLARDHDVTCEQWTEDEGPVADRLVDLSLELDLLVIGTHGRGGLSRLLHGSVSADVARSAHCPIVAVPRSGDA